MLAANEYLKPSSPARGLLLMENSLLSESDQRFIAEQLAEGVEATQDIDTTDTFITTHIPNESANVNGSGNGTYKRDIESALKIRKIQVIKELEACTYRTPPRKVAALLEELFARHQSKEGHWLFIAQQWSPRPIYRVIHQMNKEHRTGEQSIKNPAAYFTSIIKHRKKRKKFRKEATHGTG